jgi:hypothetical protein
VPQDAKPAEVKRRSHDDPSAYVKNFLPPPVRILYPLLIGRPWKKYASTLRTET